MKRIEDNLPVAGDNLFEGVTVEVEEFIRYVQFTRMPHPLNRRERRWKNERRRGEWRRNKWGRDKWKRNEWSKNRGK